MPSNRKQLNVRADEETEKRVERLPEDLRDILSTASVLGRSFDYRDLEALVEPGKDLEDAVERLVREGMLEEGQSLRERPRSERETFFGPKVPLRSRVSAGDPGALTCWAEMV